MRTIEQLRRELEPLMRRLLGATRRMAIGLTRAGTKWRLDGHDHVKETPDAEVFSNIGFTSRPPVGKGEAIVNFVGGPNDGCIVATRDEATRRAIVGDLDADETATFNSLTIHKHTASGEIEARSAAGVAVSLATKADLEALKAWIDAHVHPDPSAGFTGVPTTTSPTPTGTSVLKGE